MKNAIYTLGAAFMLWMAPMMTHAATVTFMANGKVLKTADVAVGQPLEDVIDEWPEAYPFLLEFAGWSTNATGKPQFVTAETIVNGDLTLYAQWFAERKLVSSHKEIITSASDLEEYETFYLVTADKKHTMKSSTYDYLQVPYVENGYSYTAWLERLGVQNEYVEGVGESADAFVLAFQYYHIWDKYGEFDELMNGAGTCGNFAYQFEGDDEPFFGRSEHEGRESLQYLGYNFNWTLSFTADGYAKLENEEYGYLYYSETPSAHGTNFRLSKTATPNLVAYKIVDEYEDVYVSSLDYYTITVDQPGEEYEVRIEGMAGSDFGGNGTSAMIWEDAEGNWYDNPLYAVLKGYSCTFMARYDPYRYKVTYKCSDPDAGRMEKINFWEREEMEAFVVTPTSDCTVGIDVVYDPYKVKIGDKEIEYSYDETDVYGDGSVVICRDEISLHSANVADIIEIPYSNVLMEVHGDSNIGGIKTAGALDIMSWDEPSPVLSLAHGILCTGEDNQSAQSSQSLYINGVEVFINSAAVTGTTTRIDGTAARAEAASSAIVGFKDFDFNDDDFEMAKPVGGYYDTDCRMLVDANGNPSPVFVLLTKEHSATGINAFTTKSAASKKMDGKQVIITKDGRSYNAHGIRVERR